MTAQTEAVATADAHLSNAGLPTYTEVLVALGEAADRLSVLINANRHRPLDVVARDDAHRVLQRALPAL